VGLQLDEAPATGHATTFMVDLCLRILVVTEIESSELPPTIPTLVAATWSVMGNDFKAPN